MLTGASSVSGTVVVSLFPLLLLLLLELLELVEKSWEENWLRGCDAVSRLCAVTPVSARTKTQPHCSVIFVH